MKLHGKASTRSVAKQLKEKLIHLEKLTQKLSSDSDALPAFRWLTDNSYLIRIEGNTAIGELSGSTLLCSAENEPAILSLCHNLVVAGGGRVTKQRIELFLEGCQQVYVLSGPELSLFVPMMKAAIIFELAELYSSDFSSLSDFSPIENLFTSLRLFSTEDVSEAISATDKVFKLLSLDPSGVFPKMSEKTCRHYRQAVEKLAEQYGVSETQVAQKVINLSAQGQGIKAHVGYWIFVSPLGQAAKTDTGLSYILVNALLTVSFCLWAGFMFSSSAAAGLLLFPVSQLVKTILDSLLVGQSPPRHVPRMELENGVPVQGKTLCIISALLADADSGSRLSRRLEEFKLANRDCGENLLFGILADLPDCETRNKPEDDSIVSGAENAVLALNSKYGGGFFLFTRPRSFSEKDGRYMAWERKRGAVTELISLLSGNESTLKVSGGSALALRGTHYLLTLDEDARLTPCSAKQLIGSMLHPLNTPIVDKKRRVVTAGYGILHPRMSATLSSCDKSGFSRLFSGGGGCDPYGCESSELYMDLFDNGSFFGKGIIDVNAFQTCLSGRIPENRVLSHDALEGAYLHGGFLSDTELTDSFPWDVLAYFRRLNRWTRGDWQNAPWLFRRGHDFSILDRYRLFDSLRRSLVPIAYLTSFLAAFFVRSGSTIFPALISLICLLTPLASQMKKLLLSKDGAAKIRCHCGLDRGIDASLRQCFLRIVFLPHEAFVCLSAALTSTYRMVLSKKGMLNWTTASQQNSVKSKPLKYWIQMCPTALLGIAMLFLSPAILGKAIGLLWIAAPLFALSISTENKQKHTFFPESQAYLLTKAKEIWSYFEIFCTKEDNYLPPDNYQEMPPKGIAHRSSPTNIGLCLLCCVAALDLKLCPPEQAIGLAEKLLKTLICLPKWNGHLYNWYDTRTLKPLFPIYVSTVDSGNLAACLILVREGLAEYNQPELSALCDNLLAPMSFAPLYNSKRRLLSIGFDIKSGKLSKGCYDLMASEAVTADFLAIARGDVPCRHWSHLSRAMVESKKFRGMVSWTGSMFEYLMPRLFFKPHRCSLMHESMSFCIGVQKHRTSKMCLPWGISESSYYCLDEENSFCYKAHGCQNLALKRNMNRDLVVSPYSSFLALCCRGEGAVSNLRRLESYGCACKYGFWDAIDFTKSRVEKDKPGIVSCVMAHHQGMSLVSIANALTGDLMCSRMKRDPAVSAYYCLLNEKLPLNSSVLKNLSLSDCEMRAFTTA